MSHITFFTEHSPWLIPLCLAGGALYAYVLYSKRNVWSETTNRLLAALRFVAASVLLFLLLSPFIRYISNEERKPIVAIAVDNSTSVNLFTDSVQLKNTLAQTAQLAKNLEAKNYDVTFHLLQGRGNAAAVPFTAENTNLDQLLSAIGSDYESQNLAGVVLLSDGIVNQGKSPVYGSYPFPVYTVGLGDTTVQRDVVLASLLYNKVSYTGNKLPIVAELQQNGYEGKTVTVVLYEGNKALERKTIPLKPGNSLVQVPFSVTAGKAGKRHYVVRVTPLPDEFTALNNTRHAYIDIVEGRQKILLAGAAPHPDLKALKQALEAEDNNEVSLYLPGIYPLKNQQYDLVILHQLPSAIGLGGEVVDMVKNRKLPALYILGLQSNFTALNQLGIGVSLQPRGNQTDQVTPAFYSAFSKFSIDQNLQEHFQEFPPVEVPFGDYKLAPGWEVVLKQQVGRVSTEKPLLAVETKQNRAVLFGEGIWEWRLQEFSKNQSATAFDKLFQNVAQLLTVKDNKKKLNVYPVSESFTVAQQVQFEAEAYNDVYQKIYGQRITLTLTDEKNNRRSFTFVNGENFSRFTVGSLPEGIYRYTATATINGKAHTDQGEFSVQEQELEALTAQANHNLLYQLSEATNGEFYLPGQLDSLEARLQNAAFKPMLHTTERVQELINLKWIFFLLLALLSTEWFLRKYKGAV